MPMLLAWWQRLSRFGLLGRWLFARGLGFAVPYTGSIGATVETLEPGWVRASLQEHRAVRNHLGSIHAIALANLCELASGLAMLSTMPPSMRGIVTGFSVKYLKKARGKIIAESRCEPVTAEADTAVLVRVSAHDGQGDLVCTAEAQWKVGPKK